MIPAFPKIPAMPEKCFGFDFQKMTFYGFDFPLLIQSHLNGSLYPSEQYQQGVLSNAFNAIIAHCVATGEIILARSWAIYRSQIMSSFHFFPVVIAEKTAPIEIYSEEF